MPKYKKTLKGASRKSVTFESLKKKNPNSWGILADNPNHRIFPPALRMYNRVVLEDIVRICYVLASEEKQYVLTVRPKGQLQILFSLCMFWILGGRNKSLWKQSRILLLKVSPVNLNKNINVMVFLNTNDSTASAALNKTIYHDINVYHTVRWLKTNSAIWLQIGSL